MDMREAIRGALRYADNVDHFLYALGDAGYYVAPLESEK